jgi:hypothetical protein
VSLCGLLGGGGKGTGEGGAASMSRSLAASSYLQATHTQIHHIHTDN